MMTYLQTFLRIKWDNAYNATAIVLMEAQFMCLIAYCKENGRECSLYQENVRSFVLFFPKSRCVFFFSNPSFSPSCSQIKKKCFVED